MRNKQSTAAALLAAILAAFPLTVLARRGVGAAPVAAGDSNPYLWLAQIHGRRALEWVQAQNGRSDLARAIARASELTWT